MSRVSVFVDGENISASHAQAIVEAARGLGMVDWMRVYGDAGLIKGWEDMPGFRLIHSGIGKNAADLLLCVDAMERALGGGCDAVVIASSDGDFRHLADRLRERGLQVLGVGEAKAPARFRESCSGFVDVDTPAAARPAGPSGGAGSGLAAEGWPAAITALLEEFGGADGLSTHQLGLLMGKVYGVHIREHPDKAWKTYLSKHADRFQMEMAGKVTRVCLTPRSARPTCVIAAE